MPLFHYCPLEPYSSFKSNLLIKSPLIHEVCSGNPREKYVSLSSSQYVIYDTYHLCVANTYTLVLSPLLDLHITEFSLAYF